MRLKKDMEYKQQILNKSILKIFNFTLRIKQKLIYLETSIWPNEEGLSK